MVVGGSSRSGKCEISGVCGGGRMSENSAAREEIGVCIGERAKMMLTLPDNRATRDWGVISGAYAMQSTLSVWDINMRTSSSAYISS